MIILQIRKPRPRAFEETKLLVAIGARFGGPDSGVFSYFPTLSHPYCLFLKPSSVPTINNLWLICDIVPL